MHDNHCSWNWEQTGTNTTVKNTYLFREHQQKHYAAQLTQHQIKVNRKDVLHNVQLTLHTWTPNQDAAINMYHPSICLAIQSLRELQVEQAKTSHHLQPIQASHAKTPKVPTCATSRH
jgi:hypothetical protein